MGCPELHSQDEQFDPDVVGHEAMVAVARVFQQHGVELDHLAIVYNFTEHDTDGSPPTAVFGVPHLPSGEDHRGCHLHNLATSLAMLDPELRGGTVQISYTEAGDLMAVDVMSKEEIERMHIVLDGEHPPASLDEWRKFLRQNRSGDQPDA